MVVPSDTLTRLVISGNGSARLYRQVQPELYVADPYDFPDTLRRLETTYTRRVRGGGRVDYDSLGRHTLTVDARGFSTAFAYQNSSANSPLASVTVPRLASPYTFQYAVIGSDTVLSGVNAPGPSGSRFTQVTPSGSRLASIRDPDLRIVTFTYAGASPRISARDDRRLTRTSFTYDSSGQFGLPPFWWTPRLS